MTIMNKVLYNVDQRADTSDSEKKTARDNIGAGANKGFTTCYRRINDSSSSDTWFKIAELTPGQSSSYYYSYEASIRFVCTNNGDGNCNAETAVMNIGSTFIPAVNVHRTEISWNDHVKNDHDIASILGAKVFAHRAADDYGPYDKVEIWIKTSQYFTYYTQMQCEALVNSGTQCYRSNYSTPTLIDLPFKFNNSTLLGTHSDPESDGSHPAPDGYGKIGWDVVWYECPLDNKSIRKFDLPTSIELTDIDVASGYVDIPVTGFGGDIRTMAYDYDFMLDITDGELTRGGTSSDLSSFVDAIKISIWNYEHTNWYTNDPRGYGMLFDDIVSTDLVRAAGLPMLAKSIRRVGGAGPYAVVMYGPSIRIVFTSGQVQVGDVISLKGHLTAIQNTVR